MKTTLLDEGSQRSWNRSAVGPEVNPIARIVLARRNNLLDLLLEHCVEGARAGEVESADGQRGILQVLGRRASANCQQSTEALTVARVVPRVFDFARPATARGRSRRPRED